MPAARPERIILDDQIVVAIKSHADNCAPEECCGLIASDQDGRICFAYPLTNAEHSTTSFNLDPYETYRAFTHAEDQGWNISGVFHSHPVGPEGLSSSDLSGTPDSSWLHLLLSPAGLYAYRVNSGKPTNLPIEVL